jgi:hypothetical protein
MLARRGQLRAATEAIQATTDQASGKTGRSAASGAARHDRRTLDEDTRQKRYYLLFAGSDPVPRGGLSDLVGTFTSEVAARHAFRDIRQNEDSRRSWAQLAVVDDDRGIRTLSWFGIGAAPSRKPFPHAETVRRPLAAGRVGLTASRRRVRRIAVSVIGLALVSVTAGVLSEDSASTPVAPEAVTVDAGRPADAPIIPFSPIPPTVGEGVSSADG